MTDRPKKLTSVVEEVELEVPPPPHELPLPLLLAERLAPAPLCQGEEARHEPQRDLSDERFDVLGTGDGGGSWCGNYLVRRFGGWVARMHGELESGIIADEFRQERGRKLLCTAVFNTATKEEDTASRRSGVRGCRSEARFITLGKKKHHRRNFGGSSAGMHGTHRYIFITFDGGFAIYYCCVSTRTWQC